MFDCCKVPCKGLRWHSCSVIKIPAVGISKLSDMIVDMSCVCDVESWEIEEWFPLKSIHAAVGVLIWFREDYDTSVTQEDSVKQIITLAEHFLNLVIFVICKFNKHSVLKLCHCLHTLFNAIKTFMNALRYSNHSCCFKVLIICMSLTVLKTPVQHPFLQP